MKKKFKSCKDKKHNMPKHTKSGDYYHVCPTCGAIQTLTIFDL